MNINNTQYDKHINLAIIGLLIGVAFLVRAPGLGKWSVSSDEYLLSRSVSFIQESGVPKFPSGGYYVRGIVLQYLMTIQVMLFPDREFALRLFPLLFGVFTIPIVFLFCRKMMPVIPSFFCSVILLLSSWHIEFSRFARFYSAFQFVFFVFLYFLYSGYFENNNRHRYLSWAIASVAVFIHEGSIFLPILLLSTVILNEDHMMNSRVKGALYVFLCLFALNYIVNGVDYRNWGVHNALPVDMISGYAHNYLDNLPLIIPSTHILSLAWSSSWGICVYILLAGFGMYILRMIYVQLKKNLDFWTCIFFFIIIIFPLFHQYALLGFIAVLILVNKQYLLNYFKANMKVIACYWISTLVFWIVVIRFSGNMNKILYYLVGYPSIKYHVIVPYYHSVPYWGLIASGILLIAVIHSVLTKRDPFCRFVLTVLWVCLLSLSVLKFPEISTRYSFFCFPMIFIIAYLELSSLIHWVEQKRGYPNPKYFNVSLLSLPFLIFIITDDFHLLHVVDGSSKDINYRMGKYEKFQEHWYERFDYETPALYVNDHFKKGDVVVIDSNPFAEYLTTPSSYFFSTRNAYWFKQFSRNFGREEIWSGYPMISTEKSIAELVPKNKTNNLWLISKEGIGNFVVYDFARENNLHLQMEHKGVDDRFKVWKITNNG